MCVHFVFVHTYVHTYACHSSTENKTWAEDEVDKASQPSPQGGEGAANSSSSNERAEGAQTGAGAADEQGNATSGSNDACMETGTYVHTYAHHS